MDWHFPWQGCHMSNEDELLHNIESLSNQLAGNFLPVLLQRWRARFFYSYEQCVISMIVVRQYVNQEIWLIYHQNVSLFDPKEYHLCIILNHLNLVGYLEFS